MEEDQEGKVVEVHFPVLEFIRYANFLIEKLYNLVL